MGSGRANGGNGPDRPLAIVTGFGPFPGVADNPSEALLGELARAPLGNGLAGEFVLLETSYRHVSDRLPELLGRHPAALIHLGYSSKAAALHLECRATGERSGSHPDSAGFTPAAGTHTIEGQDNEAVDFAALLADLEAAGIPATLSHDAGTYVCNHTYFTALDHIRRDGLPTKALFVHIPMASELDAESAGAMPLAAMADAIRLIARRLTGTD